MSYKKLWGKVLVAFLISGPDLHGKRFLKMAQILMVVSYFFHSHFNFLTNLTKKSKICGTSG